MRGKLWFGAASAALMMFASTAAAQEGDPAGDASTQARLGDSAVDGAFSAAGDVDWFRTNVQQGRRYTFTLDGVADAEGNAVDPMLGLYDAQGNQLAFNDDANGTLNSALHYSPSQSGDVFVEARPFAPEGTGRYRLSVTSSEAPVDNAAGDAATRARINVDRPVTAEIESEGDADWYRFNARRGQRYSITLRGAEGGAPLGDPLLQIIGRDGSQLAYNDDDGESLNSALEFSTEANGEVFIVASAFADASTGAYTLSVTAARSPTDNLSADRNTRGRLAPGDNVTSSLDFAGDADWYRIRLEEGQSYRFTLDSAGDSPLGDPLIRVRNAAGEELAIDDDGGEGFNSYLEFTAPSTGNYFIEANAFSEGGTGGYTIGARAGDVPGDSSTDVAMSADGDYREGMLNPAGDRDWYRINLNEGQGIRVALAGAEGADGLGDPLFVIYGPDGAEILRDDDSGAGLSAWTEFVAATTGAYFVEARGFGDDATGRYAISVTAGEIGAGFDTAEYLTLNEPRGGTINTNDDADWFTIEMIEGRPYRINVLGGGEGGGLADPLLTLYDSQGNQVAQDDDGGSGVNSYLTFASPTGGTYFGAVSAYGQGGTGAYQISVSDTDVAGHAYTDENLDATAADDRISRIEMAGDLDNYRVYLEAGARYVIEVNGHGDNPLVDPFLAVVDGENNRVTSDDDSGNGRDARLRFAPEQAGEYYIQASGLGGSTGWYQISIVRQ